MKLKDNTMNDKVADVVLREYLIYSHAVVSAQFPEVAGLEPAVAADYLIHLQKTGRVKIELFNETPTQIGCRITEPDVKKE